MTSPDPASIGLKVGFEIHQQLGTSKKLFCDCDCKEAFDFDYQFTRKLRPTQSELGAFDPAAMFEFSKMRTVEYSSSAGTSCLVEGDEEPPHELNPEAIDSALIFSLALHSDIMDEIHVMRKLVIDGSNTTGFQRTMLVASGGYLDVKGKKVGVQSVCLEEDAARLIGKSDGVSKYALDRLGVPLVEIALEPVTGLPEEMMQVALTLGRLLRASKRVARGIGTIRQDVNISILDGPVVEVKGVQQLDQLVKVIEYEMKRQHGLVIISQKLRDRRVDPDRIGEVTDVSEIMRTSDSEKVKEIMAISDSVFTAIKVPGFSGLIGFEPYPDVRLGKELGMLVKFYGLNGIFHSDELPKYGITKDLVARVNERLGTGPSDAFVLVGGEKTKVGLAVAAITARLRSALDGALAETRAATPQDETVYLRPRPGAARMYPETDIPTIGITPSLLNSLKNKVPLPWDQQLEVLSKRYGLNQKLTGQIFESEYLSTFEEIAARTKLPANFIASKLTEDVISIQRQGGDASLLRGDAVVEIFALLDSGSIAKESVVPVFEKLMMKEASTVQEAIAKAGATSISDAELDKILEGVVNDNIALIREKGAASMGTLMGRAMTVLRGKADGQKINQMLKEKLNRLGF